MLEYNTEYEMQKTLSKSLMLTVFKVHFTPEYQKKSPNGYEGIMPSYYQANAILKAC